MKKSGAQGRTMPADVATSLASQGSNHSSQLIRGLQSRKVPRHLLRRQYSIRGVKLQRAP
jgi:hypothetical protein